MRCLIAFVLVLGVMPMVGCTDGGTTLCEGVICDDEDDCTDDACNPADGECVFTALCDEDDTCSCTERGILCAIEAGGGPYTFDCDGPTTITTTAEVVIDNDVTLDGEGNMTINANDEHRVFSVPADVAAELRGLTMTRGSNEGFGIEGGAVLNAGSLTIEGCVVSESVAMGAPGFHGRGGGICNDGTLTLTDSSVVQNEAGDGAGILSQRDPTLTVTNSVVADNVGVGISAGGTVTVNDSTVSGNSDSGLSISAEFTMARTTVSGNSADKDGGGLAVHGGTATVTDSTFSENRAVGFGGGIYGHSPVALDGSTVANNLARAGGGVYGGGTFVNSTISGNEAELEAGGMLTDPGDYFPAQTVPGSAASSCNGSP